MKLEPLLTGEQRAIRDLTHDFAEREVIPMAAEIDKTDQFPRELYRKMGQLGLLGLLLPADVGGGGADSVSQALVQEELARGSATIANAQVTAIEEGLSIYEHASPELRERYLAGIISGELVPAFALTEPGAGSDAAGVKTTASRNNGDFVINGSKTFITAGSLAEVVIVIAVTDPAAGTRGMSAILVDSDTPGFSAGKPEELMGVRGLGTSTLHFENCRVPESRLIGEEGRGLRMGLTTIDLGRISTAAMAVGIARAALEAALDYSQQRRQFGQAIFDFQAVQFDLAEMATQIDAARLLYLHAAQLRDGGQRFVREASEAKMFASDIASSVAEKAMLIFGGNGYSKEYPVERYVRDAKLCQIFEGTNNIQHLVIARELVRERAG